MLVVVTALRLLDLGSAGVGILEAASGVGSIVGAGVMLALVGRNRLGQNLGVGIVLWGAPLVLLGLLTNTPVAIAAFALLGLGNTLVDISAVTLLQRNTPTAVAGRVFGVLESVLVGGLAIGALLAPVLVATVGPASGAGRHRAPCCRCSRRCPGGSSAMSTTAPRSTKRSSRPCAVSRSWRRSRSARSSCSRDKSCRSSSPQASSCSTAEITATASTSSREGTIEIGLAAVRSGDAPAYVGEIALLRDVPRTATVTAVTAATSSRSSATTSSLP